MKSGKDWIDKFLQIENSSIISFREYEGLRLIAKIIIGGSVAIFLFLSFNILNQVSNIPYFLYSSYFLVSGIALFILRLQKYTFGKILYILGLATFAFSFAITAPYRTGTHIHIVLLILIMMAVLNEGKHRVLFPVLFIIYLVYLASSFPGFDPIQRRVFSQDLLQWYFFINTTVFFVMCYLVFWWLINLHKTYEQELQTRAEQFSRQKDLVEEANRNLDRVVYTVTHDLRAPLNSIQGLLSLSEHASKEETAEYTALIGKQVASMKSYIQDIVEYNRNAKTTVTSQQVVLADLIQEVIDSLKNLSNTPIHFDILASRFIILKSDPVRVKVILSNLIGNAIKYKDSSKTQSTVKVLVEEKSSVIEITITDNGIGIGKEHQAKIFDMFYRATTQQEGTGLGLFIVKETIEKLGGQISVSSEPGLGSTFRFTLPA